MFKAREMKMCVSRLMMPAVQQCTCLEADLLLYSNFDFDFDFDFDLERLTQSAVCSRSILSGGSKIHGDSELSN